MHDVSVLSWMKRREISHRVRLFSERSRFQMWVILLFSAAFWYGLYVLFREGLGFLLSSMPFGGYRDRLIETVFHVFFLALLMMLVFSNAIIGYPSLFRSKETGFLLSMPVRPESIFLYRFGEALVLSSWAFIFLGTPLLAAYAAVMEKSIGFVLLSIPFFLIFLFIPAALGVCLAMGLTAYFPRSRRTLLLGLAGLLVLGFMGIVVKNVIVQNADAAGGIRLAQAVFDNVDFSENPLLPSAWVARGILSVSQERPEDAAFFFGVVLANALFLCVLAHTASMRLVPRGWYAATGLTRTRRPRARGILDVLLWLPLRLFARPVRLIVNKDAKTFMRDPTQWLQVLIFFGLLGIYFLNLRTFRYESHDLFWKNLIAQMNLLATSLTLATFTNRFVFPQLSLEGRRFWVLGMAPLPREQILYGKLAFSFTSAFVISETLLMVSAGMLRMPMMLAGTQAVTLAGVCFGLSGLAVGLGGVYPQFREENPSKIVSGFGGTLTLVLSLCFVVLTLLVQAIPCFFYYALGRLSLGQFLMAEGAALLAVAALSGIAGWAPMAAGLRAVRRLEL